MDEPCLFKDCGEPGKFEVRFRFEFFGNEKEWHGKLCDSHNEIFRGPTTGLSIHKQD